VRQKRASGTVNTSFGRGCSIRQKADCAIGRKESFTRSESKGQSQKKERSDSISQTHKKRNSKKTKGTTIKEIRTCVIHAKLPKRQNLPFFGTRRLSIKNKENSLGSKKQRDHENNYKKRRKERTASSRKSAHHWDSRGKKEKTPWRAFGIA